MCLRLMSRAALLAGSIAIVLLVAAASAHAAIELPTGYRVDAVTDRDGVTHVVWNTQTETAPGSQRRYDVTHYCQIPGGGTECTHETTLAQPEACHHAGAADFFDPVGPHVMISPFGDVVVYGARMCTYQPYDVCPEHWSPGVYYYYNEALAWVSSDDGATFGGPAVLGTPEEAPLDKCSPPIPASSVPSGQVRDAGFYREIVAPQPARPLLDSADARIVSVLASAVDNSSGSTLGLANSGAGSQRGLIIQGAPLDGSIAANPAHSAVLSGVDAYDPTIVQRARNSFTVAWVEDPNDVGHDVIKVSTFDCQDCPQDAINDTSHWTAAVTIGDGHEPRLVSGPTGTFLFYKTLGVNASLVVRRLTGATAGDPTTISTHANDCSGNGDYDAIEEPGGALRLTLVECDDATSHSFLSYRGSTNGTTWTDPTVLDADQPQEAVNPVVAADTGDGGFVGSVLWVRRRSAVETNDNSLFGPILMQTLPGSGTGTGGGGAQPPSGDGGGGDSPPPSGDGGGPPPAPVPPPGTGNACKVLQFAAVDVVADSCLTFKDGVFTAKGSVKVNGMEIAGAEVSFDPGKRIVKSKGPVTLSLGTTTIFKGSIDWKLPSGNSVKLPSISVPKGLGKLFGFKVEGSADIKLVNGAVEIPLHLGLPKILGGVSGDVTVRADNLSGIHLHELHAKVGRAVLGPVTLENVEFTYNPDEDRWSGGATISIPPKLKLRGEVGFHDGKLERVFAELTFPGEGIPLDDVHLAFLTRIRAGAGFDPLSFTGGVSFGVGPGYSEYRVAEVDGDLKITFPPGGPTTFRGDGTVKLLSVPVGGAFLELRTNGVANFGGHVDLTAKDWGVKGSLSGWVVPGDFDIEGSANVCAGDLGCDGGEAVISTKGVAGCAKFGPVHAGIGYTWNPGIFWTPAIWLAIKPMLAGCDIAEWTVAKPPSAARAEVGSAADPLQFTIAPGQRAEFVGVRGRDGSPQVTLAGPGGKRIELPASGPLRTPTDLAFRTPSDNFTWFVVGKPAPGTWHVELQPGSTPVVEVRHSNALPPPQVSAKVTGSGHNRLLHYRVKPLKGQTVKFAEQAGQTGGSIGTARGAKGVLHFHPADGPAGPRAIVANVVYRGTPRTALTVAHYLAPGPLLPARPRGLHVKRRGTRLVISWKRAARAAGYRVLVSLSDGRALMFTPKGGQRKVTVAKVARSTKGAVTIRSTRADGLASPPTRSRFKAALKRHRA